MQRSVIVIVFLILCACSTQSQNGWHLLLAHDSDGTVSEGAAEQVANAVRHGCVVRIAWGARRLADPSQTVEHVAEATWISVRNGDQLQAQLDGFMSNLHALGAPAEQHPRLDRFGGSEQAILWRALLSNDGHFDAIWYGSVDGALKARIPQQHPMRWYADCDGKAAMPLYPVSAND
ncbi:MAG: hypothetical protein AAGJ86_04690 [Pseudomonadota bacterium]